MKECGRCGELVEEFSEGTSICKDCEAKLQRAQEEDDWQYAYLNDLRRTNGRDGSEDEGW